MKKIILSALLGCLTACNLLTPSIEISQTKVEMKENPVGIDVPAPRFSWQLSSSEKNLKHLSYEIQVATSEKDLKKGENLLWSSGQIQTDNNLLIPYAGPVLQSRTTYYWRVRLQTNQGETAWSKAQTWTNALLNAEDWQAEWIGESAMSNPGETAEGQTRLAARYLRKEFSSEKKVKKAMLYICGQGTYTAFINGEKVSNDLLAPAVSQYQYTVYYNTYDVTSLIKRGDNAIGVILGNGRYFWLRNPGMEGFGLPRLLAQLEITFSDNTGKTIVSDPSWKVTSQGPIIANNEFDGEEYDARKELGAWLTSGYDDSQWKQSEVMDAPGGRLRAQPCPSICVMEKLSPKQMWKTSKGTYMVDMGQNMVGRLVATLKGSAGKPIIFRFAETLQSDSTLYTANLRTARATDIYIPTDDKPFTWAPSFVFHGFRFVEIEGIEEPPTKKSLTGEVMYDEMQTVGQFETSNEMINQIYKNAYWGIRGNYRNMPTDCPQRDERMGWLGDRATGCFGENYVFDNGMLYSKWLQDIEDAQSPEGSISVVSPRYWTIYSDDVTWPAAYFNAACMLYERYGDTSGITRHYDSMKRYINRIRSTQLKNGIVMNDAFGDWCMPPESKELIHSKDPLRQTDGRILSSTVFYDLLHKMADFAKIAGHTEDTEDFLRTADEIKTAYNNEFFNRETAQYGNNSVTGNLLSLSLGLVPEGYEERVFANIVEKTEGDCKGHVSTGVVGIQHLMRGLTRFGRSDIAYRLTTHDTYPSWGYMVRNGATTIWELWNGNTADPAMNSGNHVMLLGDLLIWYYEDLAGIKNAKGSVGFRHIEMNPCFPEGLNHVKASYLSTNGMIKSEWNRADNKFTWQIIIPGNCRATVHIPLRFCPEEPDQPGIQQVEKNNDSWIVTIGSGEYIF